MVWGFCVYFVYMIPLETDVLRKHRFQKCINLANSTFNLYVQYIKLAQNTKQFRRLVQENFITVINFLFRREDILWA